MEHQETAPGQGRRGAGRLALLPGSARRSLSRLARRALAALGVRTVRRRILGHSYLVPLRGSSLRALFRSPGRDALERSEGAYYRRVVDLARPGDTVFDVGAYRGLYTLAFAGRVGPQGRVVAFEPNPETFAILADVVRVNDLSAVVAPVHLALGDRVGRAGLWTAGPAPGSSLQRFGVAGNRPVRQVEVGLTTLDRFVAEGGCFPDLVKIDVEGFELFVLRGAVATLARKATVVCCEVHPERTRALGYEPGEVVDFLRGLGYEPDPATAPTDWRIVYRPAREAACA